MPSPIRSRDRFHGGIGRIALACGAAASLVAAPVDAQGRVAPAPANIPPAPANIPIADRYAAADRYIGEGFAALIAGLGIRPHFVGGGKGVIFRRGPGNAREIVYLDLAGGTARKLTTEAGLAALLTAAGHPVTADRLSLDDPDFDPATGILTFSAFDKRWTLGPDDRLSPSPTGDPDGDTGLSPDGRFRIVARDNNLVAIDVKRGREVALTTDGTREQPYGRDIAPLAEILKQGTETPVMPVSLRWSPDGKRIMTWRLDTRRVTPLTTTQENPPGSFYPRSFSYIYPLAGAAEVPLATRVIIDVERALAKRKATIVPVQVPAESLLYPASPDMGWVGDAGRVTWTERGYGQRTVYRIDAATGQATVVARERGQPIVTVTASAIMPAPDLGGELAISERSGWAQAYLIAPDAPDGGAPLTRGAWEVLSIDHSDAARRTLLMTGIGREPDRNPYWRALYRVTMDGKQPVLLTPEPLDHNVSVSDDGRYAIDAMSSPTVPTRTVVRDTDTGRIVYELGRTDPAALFASGYTPPEPFRGVAADGKTPLYAMIYRPAHFDPTRRYPIIDNVYTGPTTSQVPTSWTQTIFANGSSVAQLGAIVVMIDGRGTSHRGREFRAPAYQNLGEVGIDDHIAMMRQIAARYPYIDIDRAGVFGGSAGGYDAARFILRRPGFFKVAVASSGNHDLRLDKAWWPEVSMGNADAATWQRNSNMAVAGNLQGKLLLIHGDIDDNVPVTESFRLAQALIQAQRDVDLVILPNTTHSVVQPFFWRKFRDYFTRNLLDEAPPVLPALTPVPHDADVSKPATPA